jgi:hypothetical protein
VPLWQPEEAGQPSQAGLLSLGLMFLNEGGHSGINAVQRPPSIPEGNAQVGVTRQLFKLMTTPPCLFQLAK